MQKRTAVDSKIAWTDSSWNPTRTCAHTEHLTDPLRWRKPRRILVNILSALFDEELTNEQIAAVFGVMAACPQHTFLVLTKRAQRMRKWFEWLNTKSAEWRGASPCDWRVHAVAQYAFEASGWNGDIGPLPESWPLPNVGLGVSVENQAAADERIPDLLATPAAVRWIRAAPLIGPVDLDVPRCEDPNHGEGEWSIDDDSLPWCVECESERSYGHWLYPDGGIDGVVAGCASGPGSHSHACDVAWLRALRDQCAAAEVPFFLEQARDERSEQINGVDAHGKTIGVTCGTGSKRTPSGVIELPYLDGVQHAAFPEVPQ